jgi:hypothetical protein
MPGEGQADAFWNFWKDVGVMHQDEYRFTIYNLG